MRFKHCFISCLLVQLFMENDSIDSEDLDFVFQEHYVLLFCTGSINGVYVWFVHWILVLVRLQ
jgi:hypothetical protein